MAEETLQNLFLHPSGILRKPAQLILPKKTYNMINKQMFQDIKTTYLLLFNMDNIFITSFLFQKNGIITTINQALTNIDHVFYYQAYKAKYKDAMLYIVPTKNVISFHLSLLGQYFNMDLTSLMELIKYRKYQYPIIRKQNHQLLKQNYHQYKDTIQL